MSTPTYSELASAEPRKITFAQLHSSTLGMMVTWAELAVLISAASNVLVNFGIERDGRESCGAVEVTKESALERARDGQRWALEKRQAQRVRVYGTAGGTLWFGGC